MMSHMDPNLGLELDCQSKKASWSSEWAVLMNPGQNPTGHNPTVQNLPGHNPTVQYTTGQKSEKKDKIPHSKIKLHTNKKTTF